MKANDALVQAEAPLCSVLNPPLPQSASERLLWGRLHGAAAALAIASAARAAAGPLLVVVPDMAAANQLCAELPFFLGEAVEQHPIWRFPDWETLPYDLFSPLPELVSERLLTLYRLPHLERGVLLVPVATLLQRLPPRTYIESQVLMLAVGDRLDLDHTRQRLTEAGYQCVSQVIAHGEFAVRGALLDIFPMGQNVPLRIDLFDDEIDSIRTFDPDSQRSIARLDAVRMLPAREFPFTDTAISTFRQHYRAAIDCDPSASLIYREVSEGRLPGGIESYLPLFFDQTATLFDYLPAATLAFERVEAREAGVAFLKTVAERYEQRRHDVERPILVPRRLYLDADELAGQLNALPGVRWQTTDITQRHKGYARTVNFDTTDLPALAIQARAPEPAAALKAFLSEPARRVLFVAESAGRRELLREQLHDLGLQPAAVADWASFIAGETAMAMTVAPIERPLWLGPLDLVLITETQLYGERVRQERRRRKPGPDGDAVVRNLTELHPGAPVVHEEHGVGRFLGLQLLELGGNKAEFLALEYAGGDKLYVPVGSLHLIARYTGTAPESAPLHKLGSDHWDKVKRKAAQKAHDVAAELLDIYARRAARQGHAFASPAADYRDFAAAFEFEETPDQERAIEAILADMADAKPMDRVVCGDVGFGKTEVAMRAAFVAVNGGRQVAVLVPTTLLAQQHYQNFADRFADWPIRVESLSRFRSAKEVKQVTDGLATGAIDIVVGTHKLLQPSIQFNNLGLVIIDEEHRFGVRHKERLKNLRAEIDILTLTATPIPRTLNMSMAGLRDLSIIATPPVERHPIKTFISVWNDSLIQEACQREINRGGQIYFLHNEVETIENMGQRIEALVPDARIQIAHGQLRERELERVMRDFYHRRFNLLVCTTIIESGIDVPSANTILINRADKLGLAQLHQLRGRVGRSHHRAYAYLITPPTKTMTADAKKRLEAIESLEDLGAGFTLATHDLEIRGAGELLGEEQSGQIHEVGFSLYMDLLERAVQALKSGRAPELDRPLDHGAEIDLGLPALLPDDYLPDIHTRLITYKRIASAPDTEALKALKVEMIDRFGLLPEPARHLLTITELKLKVRPYGIRKIEAGPQGGRILFGEAPKIDHVRLVQLIQSRPQEFKLDQAAGALRFYREMGEDARRVAQVSAILEQLTGRA